MKSNQIQEQDYSKPNLGLAKMLSHKSSLQSVSLKNSGGKKSKGSKGSKGSGSDGSKKKKKKGMFRNFSFINPNRRSSMGSSKIEIMAKEEMQEGGQHNLFSTIRNSSGGSGGSGGSQENPFDYSKGFDSSRKLKRVSKGQRKSIFNSPSMMGRMLKVRKKKLKRQRGSLQQFGSPRGDSQFGKAASMEKSKFRSMKKEKEKEKKREKEREKEREKVRKELDDDKEKDRFDLDDDGHGEEEEKLDL